MSQNYKFLKRLGEPSNGGEVFQVLHLDSKQLYALKRRPCEPGLRDQTKKEYEKLSKLAGSNCICQVISCHTDKTSDGKDAWCVVMPLYKEDLADRMKRSREEFAKTGLPLITERDILRWVQNLTKALISLKQEGLIHRDIKPHNIFLADNDDAILGDFGIATNKTAPSTLTGTPGYMAPEISTEGYNLSVDSWSSGVVLLELLTHAVNPQFFEDNQRSIDIERKIKQIPSIYSRAWANIVRDLLREKRNRLTPENLRRRLKGIQDALEENEIEPLTLDNFLFEDKFNWYPKEKQLCQPSHDFFFGVLAPKKNRKGGVIELLTNSQPPDRKISSAPNPSKKKIKLFKVDLPKRIKTKPIYRWLFELDYALMNNEKLDERSFKFCDVILFVLASKAKFPSGKRIQHFRQLKSSLGSKIWPIHCNFVKETDEKVHEDWLQRYRALLGALPVFLPPWVPSESTSIRASPSIPACAPSIQTSPDSRAERILDEKSPPISVKRDGQFVLPGRNDEVNETESECDWIISPSQPQSPSQKTFKDRPVEKWTVADAQDWLISLGTEKAKQCVAIFEEHEIDGDLLSKITNEDLDHLKIATLRLRKKILSLKEFHPATSRHGQSFISTTEIEESQEEIWSNSNSTSKTSENEPIASFLESERNDERKAQIRNDVVAPEMEAKKLVEHLLTPLNLTQYTQVFLEQGFDTLAAFEDLAEEDLKPFIQKPFHLKQILKAMKTYTPIAASGIPVLSTSPAPLPTQFGSLPSDAIIYDGRLATVQPQVDRTESKRIIQQPPTLDHKHNPKQSNLEQKDDSPVCDEKYSVHDEKYRVSEMVSNQKKYPGYFLYSSESKDTVERLLPYFNQSPFSISEKDSERSVFDLIPSFLFPAVYIGIFLTDEMLRNFQIVDQEENLTYLELEYALDQYENKKAMIQCFHVGCIPKGGRTCVSLRVPSHSIYPDAHHASSHTVSRKTIRETMKTLFQLPAISINPLNLETDYREKIGPKMEEKQDQVSQLSLSGPSRPSSNDPLDLLKYHLEIYKKPELDRNIALGIGGAVLGSGIFSVFTALILKNK